MSVTVTANVAAEPVEYASGTGANYDDQGYLVVVTGEGNAATPLAVWAPGTWQHADFVAEDETPEPSGG